MLLTKAGLSLLLYLETCGVDRCGAVDGRRMNVEDFEIVSKWAEEGFIEFGRIRSSDLRGDRTHWVRLGSEATAAAHAERAARAERMWGSRAYRTTKEKR